ncbi:dihydrolipoamide acetyltransferase family protein [Allomuricauda sp. ARW1Y1]|jgi:2-oxoglutarate dehydrogenase E2 component (dihydrolipoamide succinyltransferase)|uniref:dihydrolipoamide acetyltransferase family protein n=1 Tax=Allomuricauda sp. ARW1Y1 TaxID=2663843 RepID=UPI0015C75179|nr:dihydrolipoamide acetyltransferase family protein [Muricauda sp. ARW1Y1]NYJ28302.1 2-oxoglutarate dehydrogenase E2 component (dihydrolipoamide succinyltransferase) [Muricauda sp. ARW1Y1]
MSKFELKLPQMGESVAEATLTNWLKEVGDTIEMDEAVFEIATDKVDSEVPSEVDGVLLEKRFDVDDVIKVGEVVAVIQIDGEVDDTTDDDSGEEMTEEEPAAVPAQELEAQMASVKESVSTATPDYSSSERFYSPLVKNIAKEENVSMDELEAIAGTGKEGRVTKNDIMAYLESRSNGNQPKAHTAPQPEAKKETPVATEQPKAAPEKPKESKVTVGAGDEIIPLSRMGKLIAHHMIESVSTSAHVQSFVEVDVTNVVKWRDKVKNAFQQREGEKLTFTPIFMEAVAMALKKYPMMNISLDGDKVIKKKNINLGMAAALPDGNLIVPVIKNADQLNLVGMAKTVNDLADRARNNQLKPDEIKDGTYTVTNVGSFGSVFGTPIINQPQVGILALGAIRKMPSVIETDQGEYIGIRSKMYLSHSYDHRVVNGALGGMFVKAVADYLEAWDINREI